MKKKVLKKAQKGISVKPTADSTAYFDRAEKSFMTLANWESKEGNQAVADKMVKLAKEAYLNKKRQSLKGKPGYDANGYPIKKKTGGVVKSKKK